MEHTRIAPAGAAALPPEMLETLAQTGLRELLHVPIPKLARAFAGFDREQIGTAIEVMIAMLDAADGDVDAQDSGDAEDEELTETARLNSGRGPGCIASDNGDISATEWHTRGRLKAEPGVAGIGGYPLDEDDELVGDETDGNGAEDEEGGHTLLGAGPGCQIGDPDEGIEDQPHDPEHDAEVEQMQGDVPMLPVHTAEHNVFTDKRVYLGRSNLMTSFRTNGGEERSADSGNVHRSTGWAERPGLPV